MNDDADLKAALATTEEARDRWHQKYTVEAQAHQDEVRILGAELTEELTNVERLRQTLAALNQRLADFRAADLANLRQALGLLTTLKPSLEMRGDDPCGMAFEITEYVKDRLAEAVTERDSARTELDTVLAEREALDQQWEQLHTFIVNLPSSQYTVDAVADYMRQLEREVLR